MEELPGLHFMRARYYSAEAGSFLSTDPVKQIGPGWKVSLYQYARANPVGMFDPSGEVNVSQLLLGVGRLSLGLEAAIGGGAAVVGGVTLATGGTAVSAGAGGVVAIPLGVASVAFGLNAWYEGSKEAGAGIADVFHAIKDDSSESLPSAVGPLRHLVRKGGSAVGLDESASDYITDVFSFGVDAASGVASRSRATTQSALINLGERLVEFRYGLAKLNMETVDTRIDPKVKDRTTDANQVAELLNAAHGSRRSGSSGSAGAGGGWGRSGALASGSVTTPRGPTCTPAQQQQPQTQNSFWHNVGNFFSSLFRGGRRP